ncbi:MAG: hypothetical protein HY319_26960 [Armatimonadetes bacterium]|nr:hypothetical protein [Armatimonadota bacterium]
MFKETSLQFHFNPLEGETLLFQRRPPIHLGPERVLYVRTRKRMASKLGLDDPGRVDFLADEENGVAARDRFSQALELARSRDEAAARLYLPDDEGPLDGVSFEERALSA